MAQLGGTVFSGVLPLHVPENPFNIIASPGKVEDVGNGAMEGEEPGRWRFDAPALGEEERTYNGQVLYEERGEEGPDLVGVRSLVRHWLKEYVEPPKRGMVLLCQRDGVTRPVDIIPLNEMGDALVKHVKNVEGGLFRRRLLTRLAYAGF
jgi:hypothetical protein